MITQIISSVQHRKRVHEKKQPAGTGFGRVVTGSTENRLNLYDYVVQHPVSTFFSQVKGDSEAGLGLADGDLLVVDRSMAPRHNSLVMAVIDGELRVCRLQDMRSSWLLLMGDGSKREIRFDENQQAEIWGKVTHVIHAV